MADVTKINGYDVKDSTARTELAGKAPLASPALTGVPTAPTAAKDTSTTQIATTEFVGVAVSTALSAAIKFKGTKATSAEVKAITSAKQGDLYIVTTGTDAGTEWVCTQDISVATESAWEQLGRVDQNLGALAYKNSASGEFTPAGTLTTTPADTATVNSITDVGTLPTHAADSYTQGAFTQGTLPTHAADTYTQGAFSAGTLPTHAADTYTQGAFTQGTLPTFSASVSSDGVLSFTFDAGTLPTHAADTYTQGEFKQGTLPTHAADVYAQGEFKQGTLPTHAADTYTQGAFTQGTLPTKGSGQTVATEGIKSASWTGTSGTVTVS